MKKGSFIIIILVLSICSISHFSKEKNNSPAVTNCSPALTDEEYGRLADLAKESCIRDACDACAGEKELIAFATKRNLAQLEKIKTQAKKTKEQKEETADDEFKKKDMAAFDQSNTEKFQALKEFEKEDYQAFVDYLIREKKNFLVTTEHYTDLLKSPSPPLKRYLDKIEWAIKKKETAVAPALAEKERIKAQAAEEYANTIAQAQKAYEEALKTARIKLGLN